MSRLRERRRLARRRRRLARLDVGLGLFAAIALLLATPGLAVAAVLALLVLALCAVWVVLERRRARRSGDEQAPASPNPQTSPRAKL